MTVTTARTTLPGPIAEVLSEAVGARHRDDPALPGSGGPAGNARLTAWTGLVLLALIIAELFTLFDVTGLISWHVVIGALLVPPALLKTASTGWRVGRYYRGQPAYQQAGPPVLLLRLLGPAVVAFTLSLLASGILLVLLGPGNSRTVLVAVLGQRVDWVTVHQALFLGWAVVTGLHLLARIVPALRITTARAGRGRAVAGGGRRLATLTGVLALSALVAVVVFAGAGSWRSGADRRDGRTRLPVHGNVMTRSTR